LALPLLPLLLLLLFREILLGKSLRLKHGWVAVVNRGQADINKRMTMVDARSKELAFFKESDSYRWVVGCFV
jgi:dynamin 1-like protein